MTGIMCEETWKEGGPTGLHTLRHLPNCGQQPRGKFHRLSTWLNQLLMFNQASAGCM